MPMKYAQELYQKYKDLSIRVDGHCGNHCPEEWALPKKEELQKQIKELGINDRTYGNLTKLCNEGIIQGDRYIEVYHIDSQEGLNRFIEIIKTNNIVG